MKVLMINGSPRTNSNTAAAFAEMEQIFAREGIETEVIQVGNQVIRGCVACHACGKLGKCVFDDIVNQVAEKLRTSDGLVIGTPVYYGSLNATLAALLDRLFYSCSFDLTMKVGAAVVVARRSGLSAAFDDVNKYFALSGMPIATSQYWNNIHGGNERGTAEDLEGLQTMRVLARNMSFLMKSIALGKEQYGLPEKEERILTNFVR